MKRIKYLLTILLFSLMIGQEKDSINHIPPVPTVRVVPSVSTVPAIAPVPDANVARRVYKRAEGLLLLEKEEMRRVQEDLKQLTESGELDKVRIKHDEYKREASRQEAELYEVYTNRKNNVKLSKEIEKVVFLPSDGNLDVENKYGDVTITGWKKDSVHISAVITVSRRNEENAKLALEEIEIQAKLWNKTLRVKSKMNDRIRHLIAPRSTSTRTYSLPRVLNGGNYSVDLDILVPKGVSVDLENKYGDINLKETGGAVSLESSNGDINVGFAKDTKIKSKYGNVEVDQIEGLVEVENANGYVSVSRITGNALIENKYGEVDVLNVDGQSEIHNYNNDVSVENIGKSTVIVNKYGSTDISNIKGDVDVDSYNGDVDVNSVEGPVFALNKYGKVKVKNANSTVDVENYNGDIELEDVKGSITVETKYGDIEIENASPTILCDVYNGNIILKDIRTGVADIDLKSEYGKVKMNDVESLDAQLDIHTKYGSIHSPKFTDFLTKDKDGSYSLTTTLGKGKGKLSVKGYNTDIHLKD